jgi:ATP-dependent helicase/nuclease subunit B
VRRWITQDRRDIGIVTNDRKLARRVRALLERANVGLVDAGGWALSTTSAATALARWLECVEQNFAHAPLLDLLKSPFLQPGVARAELDRLVPLFEQSVVRARNITSGLEHYRHGLERAGADGSDGIGEAHQALTQLLERLEDAAAPLMPLLAARARPSLEFLEALQTSLEKLGLAAGFENDDAGRELLHVLDEMRAAAAHSSLRLAWTGFHQWLRRGMEQRRFHPPMQGGGVELMSFAESRLYRFDALIIAGAVREHLPGQIGAPPYFNDSARSELGLPSLARRYAVLFQDFRRLLEAAPQVMVSLRREQDGERLVPSPWVERIRAFHALAWRESLGDPELEWLVQQPTAVIAQRDAPLPAPVAPPAAHLPPAMLPAAFTATDCQRLMDCPYQFFAARGLGLAPEDEVREEIEKVDYGIHVHRILQAFHTGVPGLPGPWQEKLDDSTRAQAEELLRRISEQVFARDLRRRFLARGWLHRWEQCIPAYLDWELSRAADWKVEATELKKERIYREGDTQITLTGRIDRLDRGRDGYAIIDYKTGAVPARDPVLRGEKIQLPFYALLLEQDNIASAAFLALEDDAVKEKTALDGEALAMLRSAIRERLLLLKRVSTPARRCPRGATWKPAGFVKWRDCAAGNCGPNRIRWRHMNKVKENMKKSLKLLLHAKPRRTRRKALANHGFSRTSRLRVKHGSSGIVQRFPKKRGGRSWPPPVFPLITCFRNASLHPLRLPCLRPMSSASICPYRASLPLQTIGAGAEDASRSSRSMAEKIPLIYIGLGLRRPGFKGRPQP